MLTSRKPSELESARCVVWSGLWRAQDLARPLPMFSLLLVCSCFQVRMRELVDDVYLFVFVSVLRLCVCVCERVVCCHALSTPEPMLEGRFFYMPSTSRRADLK